MNSKIFIVLLLSVCAVLMLSACSSTAEPLETLKAEEVSQLGSNCYELEKMQVDAWSTGDPEILRQIYTDDIVHFDGYPAYVGIDAVVSMADRAFRMLPDWQMETGEAYASKDKCVGSWINWDIFELTEDKVGYEFDLLEFREDKISFWRLFYDENTRSIDYEFLSQFAASWSQGDLERVTELYAKDAKLEDTLFGVSIEGRGEIRKYVNSFFVTGPDANWEILIPYGEAVAAYPYEEDYPFPSKGGVFGVNVKDPEGQSCEIRAFLILTPNEKGEIQSQETFYNAESLIECGWAK